MEKQLELRLEWLKSFVTVSQEENISKAAMLLESTQPTITRQMNDLEKYIGVTLLDRGKTKVSLTKDGEYFCRRAEAILNIIEQTRLALTPTSDNIRGNIYLGAGETVTVKFLMQIFAKLQKKYPALQLHVVSGDASMLQEKLDMGLINMALMLNPKKVKRFDYLDLKRSDRFGLLMKADDPLAQRENIPLAEALWLPLIFPGRMYEESKYSGWHSIRYEDLNVVASYNLISNCTYMVEQGMGYAVTIENLVNTQGRNLKFVPFEQEIKGKLYLVTKKHWDITPGVMLFLQYIKEALENE